MKLKPCPICGSNDVHLVNMEQDGMPASRIRCDDCHLLSGEFKNYSKDEGDMYAIHEWNDRVGSVWHPIEFLPEYGMDIIVINKCNVPYITKSGNRFRKNDLFWSYCPK
jgi:hypothetical protein